LVAEGGIVAGIFAIERHWKPGTIGIEMGMGDENLWGYRAVDGGGKGEGSRREWKEDGRVRRERVSSGEVCDWRKNRGTEDGRLWSERRTF
jgi:hypothetical protein